MSIPWRKCQTFVDMVKAKVRVLKLESYTLACAYQHPRTPWYAKLSILLTLGYLLSPIDLIPDFIPILGYVDDLVLVPLLLLLSIKLVPKDIIDDCREQARQRMQNTATKQKKTAWWFAIFIVFLYAGAGYIMWRWWTNKWLSTDATEI